MISALISRYRLSPFVRATICPRRPICVRGSWTREVIVLMDSRGDSASQVTFTADVRHFTASHYTYSTHTYALADTFLCVHSSTGHGSAEIRTRDTQVMVEAFAHLAKPRGSERTRTTKRLYMCDGRGEIIQCDNCDITQMYDEQACNR